MQKALVYRQDAPKPDGTTVIDGEAVTTYKACLTPVGMVEGVTEHECWLRAKAKVSAPILEWIK